VSLLTSFSALRVSYMYLFQVLTGSLDCMCHLWMALGIWFWFNETQLKTAPWKTTDRVKPEKLVTQERLLRVATNLLPWCLAEITESITSAIQFVNFCPEAAVSSLKVLNGFKINVNKTEKGYLKLIQLHRVSVFNTASADVVVLFLMKPLDASCNRRES